MPKIIDLIKPQILGEYYADKTVNDSPFLGEALFPAKKKAGLDLSFIKGANESQVLLKPSRFDSLAELRERIGIETIQTEMPLFREGMQIKEREAQEIMKFSNATMQNPYLRSAVEKVYDDVNGLISSARKVPERMRMELLSTGKISISSVKGDKGTAYNYDYTDTNFNTNNMETLTGNALWSAPATATPFSDLRRWKETMEDRGVEVNTAIMTRKTFTYIVKSKEIKDMFTNLMVVTEKNVREFLIAELGLDIIIYNKTYVDYDNSSKKYYPDDKVTLIPSGDLGNTYYGTTNEEAQLNSGVNQNVSVVDTGVAILSTVEPHPVNEKVYVAEIVLPSFERMSQIFIATVG